MDVNGQVCLVVWVTDKKGEEGRTVVYSRLDDDNTVKTGGNTLLISTTKDPVFSQKRLKAGVFSIVFGRYFRCT